jgi:tetratricopeptide (TPR) repeat protein
MVMLPVRRAGRGSSGRFISAILNHLPGAWIQPSEIELIKLYRMRYHMALEEKKYDTALIFLNKILEVDPMNAEAKFSKGEIFHRHLHDYTRAVEQYNKVIRLTAAAEETEINSRARASMAEILELLS